MEYEDIEDKAIDELTDEEMQVLVSEAEKNDPDAFEGAALLFDIISSSINSFKEYMGSSEIKVLKEALLTSFSAIGKTIDNNPELKHMKLKEFFGSGKFKQLLKEELAKYKNGILSEQQEQMTEVLKSIIPKNYYITNNKLSNEIVKDFLNNGEIQLSIIKPDKKGEILTYNSLTYEGDNISITGRQEFTAYDRAIHNTVGTLKEYGNDVITPQMVYRTLNGMTETEYVSPQSINRVRKSIDKSRFMRLRVKFQDEANIRNMGIEKAFIDSNLLYAEECTTLAGGKELPAIRILEAPALYKYAQLTKQIISVPLSLLDTREATRNTEEMIPIKEYLIRRIEIMKYEKKMSNKILYDTLFDESGVAITSPVQRNRYRKYITGILSLWRNRDKYIKNFKEYKDGKNFKGIEIVY